MYITVTEFKNNFSKYLNMANIEKIHITRNGKEIATLSGTVSAKMETLKELTGIIPNDKTSLKDYKSERLSTK